ncbi:MAG TPA: XRE family transcriptional regulator [Metalysinibacillus sp.]
MVDTQHLKNIMAKNLSHYIDRSGKTQTDISRELNIPETTMSNWIRGNTYPRTDKVQLLADYFGVRRSDLTEERSVINNVTEIDTTNIRRIPVLGEIACGSPILAEQNIESYTYEFAESLPHGTLFSLVAKGESMEPTIPDGALVIIREQANVENGEIAAVLMNGGTEATLKRVKRQGDVLLLVPDNKDYDVMIVDDNNPAKIIGKAISFKFKL